MNTPRIALIDSGIGGLNVLNALVNELPNEHFLYYGDNHNAPYGNKSTRELEELTFSIIENLKDYSIKAYVLACNTLSVSVRTKLQGIVSVPVYAVFPPVESAIIERKPTLLLATVKTVEGLAKSLGAKTEDMQEGTLAVKNNLVMAGLKELARDIEDGIFNLTTINYRKRFDYINNVFNKEFCQKIFYKEYPFDHFYQVILGCTHYNFAKKIIFDHFLPTKLSCGINNTVNMVKKGFFDQKIAKNIPNLSDLSRIEFVGSGAKINRKVFLECFLG